MTSAALIEDRLAEVEEEQMKEPPEEDGLYLVLDDNRITRYEQRRPPTLAEIKAHLGIGTMNAENAPFRALPGIVYWVYEEHRRLVRRVQIIYEEQGALFIQDEIGGAVVVTRIDKYGRIRLLSHDDAAKVEECVRLVK